MARPDYLFLIGVGRSGTNAVRHSLGLQPSIYYNGHENNVVPDLLETALINCTQPDREIGMTIPQEDYDRVFERVVNDLLWHQHNTSPERIRMASHHLDISLADYLLQVFPDARVLHLVRNGIQVVASRQLYPAFEHFSFEDQCKEWAQTYGLHQWGKNQGAAYHLLRHEWLNDESRLRAELTELYAWLEIEWDDGPFHNFLHHHYHPTQHPLEDGSSEQKISQRLRTKLGKFWNKKKRANAERKEFERSRNERWKFWTDSQLATFEEICGEAMAGFGYELPWKART